MMGAGGAADIDSARPAGTAKCLCRMLSRSGVCGEAGGRAPAAHAAPGATPGELSQDPPHACASRGTGVGAPSIVHCDARSIEFDLAHGNLGGAKGRGKTETQRDSMRFFPDTAASTIKLSLGWK